jgi:5-methylcytosine-specific restriction endonuclease McrA
MPSFFKWDMPSRFDLAKEKEQEEAAQWKRVCKVVDERDKRVCRACGKRTDPDAVGTTRRGERHHITFRSAGGKHESGSVCLLCAGCHNDVHKRALNIRGNADDGLEFWRFDGDSWYLDRREIAPHLIEKD